MKLLTPEECAYIRKAYTYYAGELYALIPYKNKRVGAHAPGRHLNNAGNRVVRLRLKERHYVASLHSIVYLLCTGKPLDRDMALSHRDGNPLNCRFENLEVVKLGSLRQRAPRAVTCAVSGFRGVYPTADGVWDAKIGCDNKQFYLGRFSTKIEAARAYNKKALQLFGPGALINEGV